MTKRFSIKAQMMIIFGSLIVVALSLLSVFVLYQSQKAVMDKVTAHLLDKASDTAVILDGEIKQWFEYLEGIASQQVLHDKNVSYAEKARMLEELSKNEARGPSSSKREETFLGSRGYIFSSPK